MHVEEDKTHNEVNEKLLPELKYTFEQDLALKSALDSKAINMITISGTITAVLIGIATFLVSRIDITINETFYVFGIITILVVVVVLGVIAIGLFIRSYTIRSYRYTCKT